MMEIVLAVLCAFALVSVASAQANNLQQGQQVVLGQTQHHDEEAPIPGKGDGVAGNGAAEVEDITPIIVEVSPEKPSARVPLGWLSSYTFTRPR